MKQALSLILAILCLLALCACSTPQEGSTEHTAAIPSAEKPTAQQPADSLPADNDGPTADPVVTETEKPKVFFPIETPFATLRAPEEFGAEVQTSVVNNDPYILGFFTKDNYELFWLHADDREGELLGTLYGGETPRVLTVVFAEVPPDSENYETLTRLQLGVGVIIDNLIEDYDFAPNELPVVELGEEFPIETSVCTLYYPSRWKDLAQIDVEEKSVKFSYQDCPVFELFFDDMPENQDAFLLGAYVDHPIYIVSYRADESFTEEEQENYYAMQANVNYILDRLSEDPQFFSAN